MPESNNRKNQIFLLFFYLFCNKHNKEVIIIKTRKQKAKLYAENYSDIPRDFQERLYWMYDKYHLNPKKAQEIYNARNQMIETINFAKEIFIVLYEEPEGSPRPRARFVNKSNIVAAAKSNPGFIQVYSLTGATDRKFMKQLMNEEDFIELDYLINTPCYVQYEAYIKTPSVFNAKDTFLAELGIIRPICKPDFDNMEKKYADMYNGNVWLDDSLVIESSMKKFYSILPRVEIRLRYLNMLYNKYQYESVSKRIEEGSNVTYFNKKE